MNPPFQPRSRAALTPSSGGRFPPPAAPNVRRGFTPRSASRHKQTSNGTHVKPKLSLQQQLEILQRLETRNFKKGEGIRQFYDQFATSNSVTNKMTCKQNLFSSFVSVDPIASSTRNYGNGMAGSMESLISVGNHSIISSTTATDDIDVTSLEAPILGGHIADTDEYHNLPDYIKAFDRMLSAKDSYYKQLEKLAEIHCSVQFAQLIPQEKMVTFFKSLERVQKIIQKFLDGNASENMKLFMPFPTSKGPPPPVIHCDVESHSLIINAFHKLNEIMSKVDSFINRREPLDFKLDAKMEAFKDLVSKLEEAIKTQDQYSQDLKDMTKKTEILQMDESVMNQSGTEVYDESPSP